MTIRTAIHVVFMLVATILLGGCGGGNSSGGAINKVSSKSVLSTVPPGVYAIELKINIPASVTVKTDINGELMPGVVSLLSPNDTGALMTATYSPATSSSPAALDIQVIRATGSFVAGDFLNIACDVASGTIVTATDFGTPSIVAYDANYVPIPTASATIEVGGTSTSTGTNTGTSVSLQTALQSGFYDFDYSQYPTGGGSVASAYAINKVGLASDGVSLTATREYWDKANSGWTTTLPSGIPTDTFDHGTEYFLNTSGWVTGTSNASGYTIAFNSDGSATITNKSDGSTATVSVISKDLSGQGWATVSSLSNAMLFPMVSTTPALPSGSTQYSLTFFQQTDSYQAWDDPGLSGISTLASIPTTPGVKIYVDAKDTSNYFFGQFGSTGVDIYTGSVNSFSPPTYIGSASYSTVTVNGQPLLLVTIPSALRTSYKLGGDPFFAVIGGSVKQGKYSRGGQISFSDGGISYSKPVVDYLKANFNSALAKPAVGKVSRRVPVI